MKNILLTGVAGFIGSKIAQSLLKDGHSVTGIDNLQTGYADNVPDAVDFVLGDCADLAIFQDELLSRKKFDTIIHFAGQSSGEISFDDPIRDLNDNCISTLNLLQFARKSSCTSFILASSMSVYGNAGSELVAETHVTKPLSMYAVGKLASEHYLRIYECYGINSVSLRLFNVYGPGQNMSNLRQGMVSIYMAQALEKEHIVIKGSAGRYRDFVYIDDVTRVVDFFVTNEIIGSEINNVCTGSKTTVAVVIDTIKKSLNKNSITVEYVESTPGDQFGIVGDHSKLTAEMKNHNNFQSESGFIDIVTGIGRFSKYLKVKKYD